MTDRGPVNTRVVLDLRRTLVICALVAYFFAVALILPQLIEWALYLPPLGWAMYPISSIGGFVHAATILASLSAWIFSRVFVLRIPAKQRTKSQSLLAGSILLTWETFALVAVVALALELANVWIPFAYERKWFDPSTSSVIMHGLVPKEWPMIWVYVGCFITCGLFHWLWSRRSSSGDGLAMGATWLTGASAIVVIASLALHEAPLGSPESMYTGYGVCEVIGLLVLFWSAGVGMWIVIGRVNVRLDT